MLYIDIDVYKNLREGTFSTKSLLPILFSHKIKKKNIIMDNYIQFAASLF